MIDTTCIRCGNLIIQFAENSAGSVSSSLLCPYCRSRNFSYNSSRDIVMQVSEMVKASLVTNGKCRPCFIPVTRTDIYIDTILDCLQVFCEKRCPSDFNEFITGAVNTLFKYSDQVTRISLIRASVLIYNNVKQLLSCPQLPDFL